MKSLEISVIIPTFNRPDFLKKAVQSVLAQSCPVREIIIIDDSSNVEFRERIKDVTRLGAHIFLHRFPSHKGASAARNFGLDMAQGDFILFLDDDDLIHPKFLESNLFFFEQNEGTDVVVCLSKIFLDRNLPDQPPEPDHCVEVGKNYPEVTYPSNPPDYLRLELLTFSSIMLFAITVNSCLVRKKSIKDTRFPEDLTAGEDTYFWLSLAFQGCTFRINKQSLAYVRLHGRNSRLREGHDHSVINYLYKLLSSGMLQSRYDKLIVHAKLFKNLSRMTKPRALRHFLFTLRTPDLIPRYLYLHFKKESREIRNLHEKIDALAISFPTDRCRYNRPRLLYITPAVPKSTGNGASMRAYSVLKALSSQYSVYLLVVSTFFENNPPGRDVSEMCRDVIYLAPGRGMDFSLTTRLRAHQIAPNFFSRCSSRPMEWLYITPKRLKTVARMFRGIQFDIIHAFRLYMAPYALLFRGKDFSGVCQLDLDDIESLTRERLSGLFALNGKAEMSARMASEATKYKDIEKSVLTGFDRVFVCSSLDRERLSQQYQCKRVEVIPNVVQIPEEETKESKSTPFTFLFVGSLSYYPNSEGIMYFCERVLPLLRRKAHSEFIVTIVGEGISRKDASSLSRIKGVNLIGRVGDVSPCYRNAHSVLIPIRAGGGTRVKALEAFAYKRPVVSTTIGVEGIDVQHEKHLLIADAEEMFAENCLRIMTDRALRKRLADNAFHLVAECHNMERLKGDDSIFLRS